MLSRVSTVSGRNPAATTQLAVDMLKCQDEDDLFDAIVDKAWLWIANARQLASGRQPWRARSDTAYRRENVASRLSWREPAESSPEHAWDWVAHPWLTRPRLTRVIVEGPPAVAAVASGAGEPIQAGR